CARRAEPSRGPFTLPNSHLQDKALPPVPPPETVSRESAVGKLAHRDRRHVLPAAARWARLGTRYGSPDRRSRRCGSEGSLLQEPPAIRRQLPLNPAPPSRRRLDSLR